jgi:hypothetical protein
MHPGDIVLYAALVTSVSKENVIYLSTFETVPDLNNNVWVLASVLSLKNNKVYHVYKHTLHDIIVYNQAKDRLTRL